MSRSRGRVREIRGVEVVRRYSPDLEARLDRYTVVDGTGRVLYRPQPKQLLLHESRAPNVFFGGAMSGGKSHALRWHGILACMAVAGTKVLLLRREFKDLENTHLVAIAQQVPQELARYNSGRKRLEFANGSFMQFGHCNTDQDFAGWLSTEWDMILVDEASTFTPWMLTMLRTRLRTTNPRIRPQFVLASNPGGESHLWLKARFIDKSVSADEEYGYRPELYDFIPSKVDDNEYVNPEYRMFLDTLPEDERRAYRDGDWDVFAGQYFRQLRRDIHGFRFPDDLPSDWREWRKFRSYDWGFAEPASMGFWLVDPDRNVYRYREVYARGLEVEDFMARVLEAGADDGEFEYTIADPACWDTSRGPSIAERAAEAGVQLTPADPSRRVTRIQGWSLMRKYIDPSTKPMLYVALECRDWWRTVPALIHDKARVEDVDSDGEDHAADETRYFLTSRPEPKFVQSDGRVGLVRPEVGTGSWYERMYQENAFRRAKVVGAGGREVAGIHPEFGAVW